MLWLYLVFTLLQPAVMRSRLALASLLVGLPTAAAVASLPDVDSTMHDEAGDSIKRESSFGTMPSPFENPSTVLLSSVTRRRAVMSCATSASSGARSQSKASSAAAAQPAGAASGCNQREQPAAVSIRTIISGSGLAHTGAGVRTGMGRFRREPRVIGTTWSGSSAGS